MYGIDSYVLRPPLGALVSLLLVAGCDAIGLAVLRRVGLAGTDDPRWQRWQAPIVGAMLLATLVYPFTLLGLTSLVVLRAVAVLVAAGGALHVFRALAATRAQGLRWPFPRPEGWLERSGVALVVVILAGAGLMSVAPPTDADSLDYHLGVPVSILITGGMPVAPEWLHGRLGGSHEVLNAIGLAGGSDNFGAVLQFAGLVGIAALVLFAESGDHESERPHRAARVLATLVALSAPVLVALIAQKPQLLPSAMTTLALALVVYPSRQSLSRRAALQGYVLVCLLTLSASQAKLSFLIAGGVVGLLALAAMARRGLLWPALAIGVVATSAMLLPQAFWKQHYFHDTLVNSVVKTTPGTWPGSAVFDGHLRGIRMREPFPLFLLIARNPYAITVVLGPAVAILLAALRPGRDPVQWVVLASIAVVSAAMLQVGPRLSRYYLEPFFWLAILFALQARPPGFIRTPWFAAPLLAQALCAAALFWYGAVTLAPGALAPRLREAVMDRYANGYHVLKWVDSVLPANAVLLSADRSLALAPRDVVSFDWTAVAPVRTRRALPYLNRLKARGVTHVLVGEAPGFMALSGCFGPLVAGPVANPVAVRNPFAAPRSYPAWVYEFRADELPACAKAGR